MVDIIRSDTHLTIRSNNRVFRIRVDDILVINHFYNGISVSTSSKKFIIKGISIREIYEYTPELFYDKNNMRLTK